ncbi:osmoprotectant ABC transporter ATP-binding subunit YehX [Klebsiella pneumoniae]|uniref:Osmoprotectant ABC transporter ATP-binding subunit YehX n=1 Tax=Klebsiella pneumoniae TaxID=573 RepID=A0A377XRI7_KLEPN|nr:osmoprotectant ABC transporter ATP-binding subunit YehX [Klebsiella pneumoniae]
MIEFQGVSKVFAGHPAVKDLTLELREGAFSVLVGTSGSGKSTTLKMINRLLEPDRGTIRFAGEDIRLQPVLTLRRRMGYAIQSIGPVSPLDGGAEYRHRAAAAKMGRGQGSPTGSTS